MPLILVLLFIIAAIFVEIAGFIVVGARLGVVATLVLLLAAMLAGVILLRLQGKGLMQRMAQELENGQVPDRALVEGLMMVLGSILLIIPGFVSDVIGLLLFIPPLRMLLWRPMSRYVTSSAKFYTRSAHGQRSDGDIVDLEKDEYQAQGDKKSPWRRMDNEKNRQ